MEEPIPTQPQTMPPAGRARPAGAWARLSAYPEILSYGLLGLAVLLWLLSLPRIDPRAMTDLGLVSVLPPGFYLALIVLTASFSYLVYRRPAATRALLLHLVALIAVVHATPALRYGTLRYAWAWKHVGIVDYIQRFGRIDPDIPLMNAYHNWPGFFALNALLTEAAGLTDALGYATWATVFFNLLFLGALLLVYRSLTIDPRVMWTAAWFFFLGNWIGQDYFSPQSFAFFFYLALLGILLGWFQSLYAPVEVALRRWVQTSPRTRPLHAAFRYSPVNAALRPSTPGERLLLMGTLLLLMAAIVYSHQLTPILMVAGLAGLSLLGLIYPRRLPLIAAVMTVAWIWLVASSFMGPNFRSIISSLGTLGSNVSENLINLSVASPGQVTVSLMGRGLTLLVILLAGLGLLRRLQHGYLDFTALLLGVVPFVMLVATSYGGEILFRIYFFALPMLAFLIACLFYASPQGSRHWAVPVAAATVSIGLIVAFLFSYYGKERQYYMSPGEVAASEFLFQTAPPGSLIVEGTRNYPSLFRNYEQFIYVAIAREPEDGRREIIAQPVETMVRWMSNRAEYPASYLILTRSMAAEVDMVGAMPRGSLAQMQQALDQSGRFNVIFQNEDAVIYTLKEP